VPRSSGHGLATHHLAGRLHAVEVVHFIFEGGGSDRSSGFENAQLLLVQDLGVCKVLIRPCLAQMRRPHHLLGHHQVVVLGAIYSLLALNRTHAVVLDTSLAHGADGAHASDARRHTSAAAARVLLVELFDRSRSIRIFA